MSDRMRLLFTASPAYGHLLPLLPMIRAAMTAGHDVRLATGPDMVGPMRGAVGAGVRRRRDVGRDRRRARRGGPARPRRGPRRATRGLGQRAVRPRGGPAAAGPAGHGRPLATGRRRARAARARRRHARAAPRTAQRHPRLRPDVPRVRRAGSDRGRRDRRPGRVGRDARGDRARHLSTRVAPTRRCTVAGGARPAALRGRGRRARGVRPGSGPRAAPSARLRHPRHHLQRDPRPDGRDGGGAAGPVGRPGGHHRAGRRPRLAGPAAGARDRPSVRPPGPGAPARGPDGVPRGSRHHARRAVPRGAAALPAARRGPALERRGGRPRARRDRGAGGGVHARGRPGGGGDAAVVAVLPYGGTGGAAEIKAMPTAREVLPRMLELAARDRGRPRSSPGEGVSRRGGRAGCGGRARPRPGRARCRWWRWGR